MTEADKIFNKKMAHVLASLGRMDSAVVAAQKDFYALLLSEYLPQFETMDGVIIESTKNDNLINKLDNYFNRLEKALQRDVLGTFAANVLESASLSAEYYVALGFKDTVVDGILKGKINLEKRLGITPSGRLDKKGYLYRLGKTAGVRNTLTTYVTNALTGDVAFLDLQLGLKNLVIGSPKGRKKGLATTGSLQRYFDQFAYDSFNQLDETANRQFAQNLNLKHFVYEGSVIKTTRPFCEKRAGKAFTVKETKFWKDDPDLIDKKTKESYLPLVERGRKRCRHFIKYITEALYNKIK